MKKTVRSPKSLMCLILAMSTAAILSQAQAVSNSGLGSQDLDHQRTRIEKPADLDLQAKGALVSYQSLGADLRDQQMMMKNTEALIRQGYMNEGQLSNAHNRIAYHNEEIKSIKEKMESILKKFPQFKKAGILSFVGSVIGTTLLSAPPDTQAGTPVQLESQMTGGTLLSQESKKLLTSKAWARPHNSPTSSMGTD